MNTIASLVTEDPMQARELLVALGDLLRDATSLGDEQPLAAEIAWLERYVAIHAARFPGQFSVRWEIDADVRQARIPSLLLQPLVENALSHGMAQATEGHIAIAARWEPAGDGERNLFLEIRDDGPQLGPPREGGKGLTIVRRRLALRTPSSDDAFALVRIGDWTCARVVLREATASEFTGRGVARDGGPTRTEA
jgi:LytS/YehU family sensor histidine kinase